MCECIWAFGRQYPITQYTATDPKMSAIINTNDAVLLGKLGCIIEMDGDRQDIYITEDRNA